MVTGDASQLHALGLHLEHASGRIGAAVAAVVIKTAYDVEADAKVLVISNETVDTGDMLNSISTEIIGDGRFGRIIAEIGPTVEYAPDVEYGTQPHDIPNAWGRGITVHHPGTEPKPFMRPAFERRTSGLESAIDKAFGNSLP